MTTQPARHPVDEGARPSRELPMKNIYFFATPNDIRQMLHRVESNAPLKFVESGTKFSSNRNGYLEANEIPYLGVASHETGSQSSGYMVTLRDTENNVRTTTMKNGALRWDLHNSDTQGSVILTPAGLWKDMLLAGNVCTIHDDPAAQILMKQFHSAFRSTSAAKAGRFWVGREALEFLDSGRRLSTTAEQSPPEFNIQPEHVKRA